MRPSGLVRFPSLDEGDWRMGDRWNFDVALVKEVDAVPPGSGHKTCSEEWDRALDSRETVQERADDCGAADIRCQSSKLGTNAGVLPLMPGSFLTREKADLGALAGLESISSSDDLCMLLSGEPPLKRYIF